MVSQFKRCWCMFFIILTSVCWKVAGEPSLVLQVNRQRYSSAGDNVHWFVEDEGTHFNCSSSLAPVAYVLTYNSSGGAMTKVSLGMGQPGEMYMKLRRVNNGSTVTCGVQPAFGDVTGASNVSVRLLLGNNTKTLKFIVNGLVFSADVKYHNLYFTYKYNLGEAMSVRLLPHSQLGPVDCTLHDLTTSNEDTNKKIYKAFTNVTLTINEKKNLVYMSCNSESNSVNNVVMTFIEHFPYYNPAMYGLSMSRILLQFSNATTNVIRYDIGDEDLLVSCPGVYSLSPMNISDYFTSLDYDNSKLLADSPNNKPINGFRLRPGQDRAEIRCQWLNSLLGNKTTSLQLQRRQIKNAELGHRGATTGYKTLWIVVVVLSCVALAAVACVVRIVLRRRSKPSIVNILPIMQYQNLRERQLPQSTTPEDVIYAEPNTFDTVYANLTPNDETIYTTPIYAKPAPGKLTQKPNELTYANENLAQTNSIEELYAKPVPKSERTKVNENSSMPKNQNGKSRHQIEPTYVNENTASKNQIESEFYNNKTPGNNTGIDNNDVTYAELYEFNNGPSNFKVTDMAP